MCSNQVFTNEESNDHIGNFHVIRNKVLNCTIINYTIYILNHISSVNTNILAFPLLIHEEDNMNVQRGAQPMCAVAHAALINQCVQFSSS